MADILEHPDKLTVADLEKIVYEGIIPEGHADESNWAIQLLDTMRENEQLRDAVEFIKSELDYDPSNWKLIREEALSFCKTLPRNKQSDDDSPAARRIKRRLEKSASGDLYPSDKDQMTGLDINTFKRGWGSESAMTGCVVCGRTFLGGNDHVCLSKT